MFKSIRNTLKAVEKYAEVETKKERKAARAKEAKKEQKRQEKKEAKKAEDMRTLARMFAEEQTKLAHAPAKPKPVLGNGAARARK